MCDFAGASTQFKLTVLVSFQNQPCHSEEETKSPKFCILDVKLIFFRHFASFALIDNRGSFTITKSFIYEINKSALPRREIKIQRHTILIYMVNEYHFNSSFTQSKGFLKVYLPWHSAALNPPIPPFKFPIQTQSFRGAHR